MTYQFDLTALAGYAPEFLRGALLTIWLTVSAILLGTVVALVGAIIRSYGPAWLRAVVIGYVELIRNTPFLVQIFFIFFGLPTIGIRLSPDTAALVAMVVNFGAYGVEILRAGLQSVGKGQFDAARALGLSQWQTIRFVVLKPAFRTIYPALTSQFILLMLTSSVVSAISANDLTSVANDVSSITFKNFEVYLLVTLIYLAMATAFSAIFAFIERLFFSYPTSR